MRSILSFLGLGDAAGADLASDERDTETVRRISEQLDLLEPARARWVAAFAYVLARVARADLELHPDEILAMERHVAEVASLPGPQAALVVQIARHQATHRGGTEDYLVTRQFREVSDRAERLELIRCLFAVGAADGSISQLENQTISQIGAELGLTAQEIAACRAAFRDRLAVLKDLPRPSDSEDPSGAGG